jgi:hypothetical protein
MEVLWENMSGSFKKRKLRNWFSWPVLVHVRTDGWFSHITMSIGSHCKNQVENQVTIRELPNTGMGPWPTVLKNQRTSNDPEPWFSKNINLPWTTVHIKELLHTLSGLWTFWVAICSDDFSTARNVPEELCVLWAFKVCHGFCYGPFQSRTGVPNSWFKVVPPLAVQVEWAEPKVEPADEHLSHLGT